MANLVTKGTTTFSVNDILRLKDSSEDEWLKVLSVIDSEHYTVERDMAGVHLPNDNVPWTAGTAIANYGQSGDGLIYMTASEPNSPYIDVLTHDGSPWSSTNLMVRLGELDGIVGATGDGIYADYGYLGTIELYDLMALDSGGKIRTSLDVSDYPYIEVSQDGIKLRDSDSGGVYGTAVYGTDRYGYDAVVWIMNSFLGIPWAELKEPTKPDGKTMASLRLYNRSSVPTGPAEVGDFCFVNNSLQQCTIAGTPGTWSTFLISSGSSTDNAVPKFDGVTGSILQNTGLIINDNDLLTLVASTTDDPSLNMPVGTAPTSPSVGDFWSTSDDNGHLYYRKNSSENIDLSNASLNIVYVNTVDDLPDVSSGGKIFLEANTLYEFPLGISIAITDDIVFPQGKVHLVNPTITTSKSIILTGGAGSVYNISNFGITFTGVNATAISCTDLVSGSLRIEKGVFTATATMTMFDITATNPSALVLLDNVAIGRCGQAGIFDGPGVGIFGCRLLNFSNGFELIDNTQGININLIDVYSGQNTASSIMLDISGTVGQTSISDLHATPKSNEKIFNFDSALTFDGIVVANSPIDLTESGVDLTNVFEAGSLNETTIGVKFTGNVNIQDSTALAQMGFQGNTTEVVIDTAGVPIKINSNSFSEDYVKRFTTTSGGTATYIGLECTFINITAHLTMKPVTGTNIELGAQIAYIKATLVTCTFTNATNKVNKVAHGLVNDTSIRFSNSGGALPAAIRDDQFYWVINKTDNDFEISDTLGGAAHTFADDGTGTSYYSLGGIMDSSHGESSASSTRVESLPTQSLLEMETGDKIEVFVHNDDTTSNVIVENIQVIINKV